MCITKGERKISRSHLPKFSFGKNSNKKIKYILHKSSYIQNRIEKKTSSLLSNTHTHKRKELPVHFFLIRRNLFILVPVTISIPHRDSSLVENDNISLFLLNITSIDWYLISTKNSIMTLHSPSSTNRFRIFLSTTPPISSTSSSSSTILPMALGNALPVALVLSTLVVLCIFGNILVILSVFTFRPLRTVQNFFIVSLAFSDVLVAIIVMPFHIVTHILKRWIFGREIFSWLVPLNFFFAFRTTILSNFCHIGCSSMYIIDIESLCYCSKIDHRRGLFI